MKIILACVGKLRSKELERLCDDYAARLRRYGPFAVEEVRDGDARERRRAIQEEGRRLLALLRPGDRIWTLDEKGRQASSPEWARNIEQLELHRAKRLVLLLGGAHGLSDEVRRRGSTVALSRMTLPHELCRLVVLEQLYRARTIQRGEPYHH